jgi:hypothetical protein
MRFTKTQRRTLTREELGTADLKRWQAIEQQKRDCQASAWRTARMRFFEQPEAIRAAISKEWHRWTGPTTSTYFLFIIENVVCSCVGKR